MLRLTLFFIISEILHRFLRPLNQTEYISKILAGIILGPSVLGRYEKYEGITNIPSQVQFINVMSYIGFLYYVFVIAVKTDSAMIMRFQKQFWVMGLSSMIASCIVMVVLCAVLKPLGMHSNPTDKFIFPLQLSSTWFTNLVPLLEELNLLTTEFGQFSLTLALTNEFLMWSCVIFIIILKTFSGGFIKSILPLFTIFFLILCVVRPMLFWVIKQLPRGQPVKDIYVVSTLLGAALSACLSDVLVGSPLMGIIFIGLVVPHGPPLGSAIVERGETFIKICLLPFFFLAVGDSVIFDTALIKGQILYQLIIVAGYLAKIVTLALCAVWYDMRPRQGLALGLIMCTSGAIHTMVYWSQWIRQRADVHVSSQLILSSIFVTSIATPLASHFHKQSEKDDRSIRGFQLSVQSAILGSRMHILVCIDNEEEIPGIINLLEASNSTTSHPICVYLVHLIELVGQAAPMLIPHKKHNRICKYNGCIPIMNAVKSYCDASEGGVTIQLLTMIAPFTSIYESICKLASDKMIPLLIVPFIYKSLNHFGNSGSSQLNYKLQRQTPCTLGIFVNKSASKKQMNRAFFSYHVGVIFCGGEDDREALTYATRMSTHPGVSVTLFRIFIKEYDINKSDADILRDNSVVDSFKAKTINNGCAISKEFQVDEWLQTLGIFESVEKSYDLVMLGRCHGQQASLEHDMFILSENPELGEIGELIISGDLEWENTSFLVMQHCLGGDKETKGNVVLLDDS